MNAQDTFDLIVDGLRKQGRKSRDARNEACMYRGGNDKCAAGLLIPDEKYCESLEGMPIYLNAICGDITYRPGMANPMKVVMPPGENTLSEAGWIVRDEGHDLRLVRQLQEVHDGHEPDEWEVCFSAVADLFGLTYTSPA